MAEITCNWSCCLWNKRLTCQKEKVQIFDKKCYGYNMYLGDDTKKDAERAKTAD